MARMMTVSSDDEYVGGCLLDLSQLARDLVARLID
jgi:hypothetical protein